MGMDVSGKKPTSEAGIYFRNNVWAWSPLATYVETVCQDLLTGRNCMGYTNDGQGMTAAVASKVAARLEELLASGDVKRHELERQRVIDALPAVRCGICAGDGVRPTNLAGDILIRTDWTLGGSNREGPPETGRYSDVEWATYKGGTKGDVVPLDDLVEKPCNGCHGDGRRQSSEASYHFSEENVRNFAAFAAASGGFRVY